MKIGLLLACLLAVPVAAGAPQGAPSTSKPAPKRWTMPRTADGHPDLEGVWANNTITPLERPKQFADKPELTDAEFAHLEKRVKEIMSGGDAIFGDDLFNNAVSGNDAFRSSDTRTGNYSQVWLSDRFVEKRTSLIVDPPNGRIPARVPQAAARQTALAPRGPFDALGLSTRCITMGMPNLFAGYQSYFEFVQSRDYVVLRTEMIHEARIIPLDGRPHVPSSLRQWHGDSRGRWEGDTLVVDTTNFSPRSNFRGSSENLHLVERFTRVDADTIDYRIIVEDPTTWVQPWTILIKLRRANEGMFEYACHEGNYGMAAILSAQQAETK